MRVAGDDLADGGRDVMLCEKLDHPVAIGVADRAWGIHDDRACLLCIGEAIKNFTALAHDEYVGATGVERGVGVNKLDIKAPHRQSLRD